MLVDASTFILVVIFHWTPLEATEKFDGPLKCVIVQDKESVFVPFAVPSFLKNTNRSQCQVRNTDTEKLRCGQTNVYIKPECVCSFYNVYEASLFHGYSSCPSGSATDIVTKLKCPDCKKFSLNNNGPCINGGKLTCKGDELAPDITCQCLPNYKGMFCENKLENVTRVCSKIALSEAHGMRNCNITGKECVTYSRRERYVYRCQETDNLQDRGGQELPLCIDAEDFKMPKEMTSTSNSLQVKGYVSMACMGASNADVTLVVLMLCSSIFDLI